MKKTVVNLAGVVLFYSVIVIGVLLLNMMFEHLNNVDNNNFNEKYIAMNN